MAETYHQASRAERSQMLDHMEVGTGLLKRQMYGRANFDLLRQRVLHAS